MAREIPCMHYYTKCMACLMVLLEKEIQNQLLWILKAINLSMVEVFLYGNSVDQLHSCTIFFLDFANISVSVILCKFKV